ncbi:MAG TPA: hypothetical protein VF800_15375 [Telluria sp.]|jgi:hypothetical protein
MGMSRKRKDAFKAAHPFCIFCGGTVEATTVEHCPPRAMFQKREWPEGFEFAACSKCNHGSADQDLLIALLARVDPFEDSGSKDGRMPGIIGSIAQKFPGLIKRMMPTANEARRINERLGISVTPGQTNQQSGAVHVVEEIHHAVEVFAAKLTKAIYYQQTNMPFPLGGRLAMRWFTNADLITNNGRYQIFDLLSELVGIAPTLRRARSFLNDQFSYKLTISDEKSFFVLQAQFGAGFGFVVFGSTASEKLDAVFINLEEKTQKPNPFIIL